MLDDGEVRCCEVLCDEVFGRRCFLGTVIWEESDALRMGVEFFSSRHDGVGDAIVW